MMQRISLLSLLCGLFFTLTTASANVVDRSVAIVNDDTITLSEVNELGQSFSRKSARKPHPTVYRRPCVKPARRCLKS